MYASIRSFARRLLLRPALGGLLMAFLCLPLVGAGFPAKPAPATHSVAIKSFKFQPDVLTVNVGDTVEWKNGDIVAHTVLSADKSINSGTIAPGATWKYVAKKAGAFPYTCAPHPNMHAKLIVR